MVVQSFIPEIFNYCDRWCERCPLSHRCALADRQPSLPGAAETLYDLLAPEVELDEVPALFRANHPLASQSREWLIITNDWLACCFSFEEELPEPIAAIEWHATTVCMKIGRATSDFQEIGDHPHQSDAYGSAKVATLSLGTVLDVLTIWCATHQLDRQALVLLDQACDLMNAIEAEFPGHLAFERPGFDTGALGRRVVYGPKIWLI